MSDLAIPAAAGSRRGLARVPPRDLLLAAWCALSAGVLAVAPLRALRSADATDYVAFATGGRILHAGSTCLYCFATEASTQTALLGHVPRTGVIPYANPPLAAWLLQPVATLPLQAGLAVFLAAGAAALALAALLLWRLLDGLRPDTRLALCLCAVAVLPGSEALAFGQWDPLLLAALCGSLLLLRRGDMLGGGLLLSVLWVKPQVVWMAVPLLLAARHHRAVAGLLAGGAAWVLTGVAVVGPGGIGAWWDSVAPGRISETGRSVGLPALATALTGSHGLAFGASAALAGVATVTAWRMRSALRADPLAATALGVTLSLLLAPHVFDTDLLLLAAPLAVAGRRRPAAGILAAVALGLAHLLDGALPEALAHSEALAVGALAVLLARTAVQTAAGPSPASPAVAAANG